MNSINEKEKKLISVLDELKNLDLANPKLQNNNPVRVYRDSFFTPKLNPTLKQSHLLSLILI